MAELVKFTEKTIDYAKNPRNQGDMENPTAIGEVILTAVIPLLFI